MSTGLTEPSSQSSVVRSGDYYLFETDSEDSEEEEEKGEDEPPKKSTFQVSTKTSKQYCVGTPICHTILVICDEMHRNMWSTL